MAHDRWSLPFDKMVIQQLGVWREVRALASLERIAASEVQPLADAAREAIARFSRR